MTDDLKGKNETEERPPDGMEADEAEMNALEDGPEADLDFEMEDGGELPPEFELEDSEEIRQKALDYLDSDPVKNLYGEESYEEHINPEAGDDSVEPTKGRANKKKQQKKQKKQKDKKKRSEKYKFTRDSKPRNKVHKKKHYFLKFLGICAIIAGLIVFMSSSLFDVSKIEAKAGSRYKAAQLIEKTEIKKGTNIFRARVSRAEKNLEKDPYIEEADVSRVLPDKITVEVTERTEMAYFAYGKKFAVIDINGKVLRISDKAPRLTRMIGVEIKEAEVGEEIKTEDKEKYEELLSLLQAMSKQNLFFKKIALGKTVTKVYIYDRLICKGSTKNILENIENGNLEVILTDLVKKKVKKGTINITDEKYCSYTPDV